jgi:hypothetical protein
VRILREYERAVVFTLGRFQKVKGPGLVLLVPFIQEMVRVDLRIQVIEIPSQDVISRDNVLSGSASVTAIWGARSALRFGFIAKPHEMRGNSTDRRRSVIFQRGLAFQRRRSPRFR